MNDTNNPIYVRAFYDGYITTSPYGVQNVSYWHAVVQPDECLTVYKQNSVYNPYFRNGAVTQITLLDDDLAKQRSLCKYQCPQENIEVEGRWIAFFLNSIFTEQKAESECGHLQWYNDAHHPMVDFRNQKDRS